MKRLFLVLIATAAVAYLLTGLTQVRPGERAVVRRFGRVLDERPEPGLWVGLPWGMDRVDRVPIDLVRRVEVGYSPDLDDSGLSTPPGQLVSGDHNLVNVRVAVSYAVLPDEVADYVVHADVADGLVARAAEAAAAEWVAGRSVDDVLLRGKVELPAWLVAEGQRHLDAYRLGVALRDASVTHLHPPAEVKGDFELVTQTQTEMRTKRHRAEEEAERLRRSAESEKYRMEQMASSYGQERRLLARAEAESFERRRLQYDRLKKDNPDALAAFWWEEMGRLYAKLREGGRVDLLDNRLGADGLDITVVTPPKK